MAVSFTGPYETYCYAVGPKTGTLWGGTYFAASRVVEKCPPEMRSVLVEPTYEERMMLQAKATRCSGCGKPDRPKHKLRLMACYGHDGKHKAHPNSIAIDGDRHEWRWAVGCYLKLHPEDAIYHREDTDGPA